VEMFQQVTSILVVRGSCFNFPSPF
jgi:hypothetical protein